MYALVVSPLLGIQIPSCHFCLHVISLIPYPPALLSQTFPHSELAPGLALLGPIDEKFVETVDLYEPLEDGRRDRAFISKGYDATSHFETTVEDVLDLYQRITGKVLDLSKTDFSKRQEQ